MYEIKSLFPWTANTWEQSMDTWLGTDVYVVLVLLSSEITPHILNTLLNQPVSSICHVSQLVYW
jgi:hypothetical protein